MRNIRSPANYLKIMVATLKYVLKMKKATFWHVPSDRTWIFGHFGTCLVIGRCIKRTEHRDTMKVTLNLNDSLKSEISNVTYDFTR